jgi:transmembrane sensor
MDDSLDPDLLARFLASECTHSEQAQVVAWLEANPDRQHELDAMRRLLANVRAARPRGTDPSIIWGRIQGALDREETRLARAARPRTFLLPMRASVGAGGTHRGTVIWRAAQLAAVLVLAFGWIATWRLGRVARGQPFREFASAPGSRTTVTLHDGTRIVLGPATRLRVPANFAIADRRVELDGEAVFTVVHDALRPFAVKTDRAVVWDVGTTFAVHAYQGDADMRVAVAEGEVKLVGVALRARDIASVGRDGRVSVDRGADVDGDFAWVRGGLEFRATPLREAALDIGRLFGVDVTVPDSALGDKPVSASFAGEPLDVVLEIVSRAAGAHYERNGHVIVIRRGVTPTNWPVTAPASGLQLTRVSARP